MEITIYKTVYAAWLEGQDELEVNETDLEIFRIDWYADQFGDWNDDETEWIPASAVATAVHLLTGEKSGFYYAEASSSEFNPGVWYLDAGYEHPYTGERTEMTAHLEGFTEDEQRAIYALVTER